MYKWWIDKLKLNLFQAFIVYTYAWHQLKSAYGENFTFNYALWFETYGHSVQKYTSILIIVKE